MTSELKAGLFVLAALASLVYMTSRITQNRYSVNGTKKYFAMVKDATGLANKTKIKMAGLDVGQLESIDLIDNHPRLTMQIATDMTIHQDARVTVKSIGFLGDKYVELYAGSSTVPNMEEGGTIQEGSAGGGLDELTSKTTEVVANIKEITDILKEAMKGKGEEEESRLDRILDNMENFTAGLSSIEKYGELADRLNEVAINIRDISDKIKKGEGTVGKLLTDSDTIDKINSTLSGVNKFINRADKTSLIIDGHGGMLTQTGGSKGFFSISFQPTYDKYYLLGLNTGPRPSNKVTRTTTTVDYGKPQASTSTKEENEQDPNALFFNVQFGKRFSNTIVRLGLFETSVGFGVDQWLMEEKIKLYTEAYRFGRSAGNPISQINLGSELHVFKPFYVWLGGDDLLNNNYRNFFIGAGLRFTDNDLKSLVSVAATSAASSTK